MIGRHPHVFGADEVAGSAALKTIWEERKAAERAAKGADASVLADVPVGFPALTRALKLQKRAARVGFDWGAARADPGQGRGGDRRARGRARPRALPAAERELELGDLLFTIVNLARHLEIDPEAALRATNAKFERRFRSIEAAAKRQGRTAGAMTLDELEALCGSRPSARSAARPGSDAKCSGFTAAAAALADLT